MRNEHVVGIDVLRFFAACLVMAFHLGFFYLLEPGAYPLSVLHISGILPYTSEITRYGYIGVEIFFVVSGYVISFSIEGRTRAQYVRSRFLRLWPTVWVCATACFFLAIITRQGTDSALISRWARSMVIFPKGPWIDGVYWTLPIEIAFYLLLLLIGDQARGRKLIAFGLGTASMGFWVIYLAVHSVSQLHNFAHIFDRAADNRVLDIFFFHYGIYFSLGMLLHTRIRKTVMLPFCLLIACAAFIEIDCESIRLGAVVHVLVVPLYAYALWLASMAYFVVAIRYNLAVIAAIGQRRLKILKGIGALTYPLYLLHVIIANATAYLLLKLGTPLVLAWSLGPLFAIFSAMAIAHWMEPKARGLTGRVLDYLVAGNRLEKTSV